MNMLEIQYICTIPRKFLERNIVLFLALMFVLAGCDGKKSETDVSKKEGTTIVAPAGISENKKKPWDGVPIIDLDSVMRTPIKDLLEWKKEWHEHSEGILGSALEYWTLPDGSRLKIARNQTKETRGGTAYPVLVSVEFWESSWTLSSNYDAMAACGFYSDRWKITWESGPNEYKYQEKTRISTYTVANNGVLYEVVVLDSGKWGYTVQCTSNIHEPMP